MKRNLQGLFSDYLENLTEYLQSEDFQRNKGVWAVAFLVSLCFLTVLITHALLAKDSALFLLARCFFLISPLCLFLWIVKRLFKEIDANKEMNRKLAVLKSVYDSEKCYYESVRDNDRETFELQQQTYLDVQQLLGQLDRKDYAELEKYCNSLLANSERLRQVKLCGHQVVDSVVGYWQLRAWKQGIEFTTELQVEELQVNDLDLAIVLGNALENAYTAAGAQQVDQPYIKLKLQTRDKLLLIMLENSYNGILICRDDNYYSAKRNFQEPGTGLSNIKLLVEKYKGYMKIIPSAKSFKLQIALTNKRE